MISDIDQAGRVCLLECASLKTKSGIDVKQSKLFLTIAAVAAAPALAVPPSGLSQACGKAWESMNACRAKFAASGAPASMKQMFNQNYAKQQADAVTMWRMMCGQEAIEQSCKEIAANPTCEDRPD